MTGIETGIYSVKVTNLNGCSAMSDNYNFTLSNIIKTNNKDSKVNIYPNPNNGSFTLHCDIDLEDVNVEITDNNGKIVYKGKVDAKNKNLTLNLVAGTYFAKFQSNEIHEVVLFIVNK